MRYSLSHLAPLVTTSFLFGCFEPFPEFPELADPPSPVIEDAMMDMAPPAELDIGSLIDMEPDMELDMAREVDMELPQDMELDMELDMEPDMTLPPRFEELTSLTCSPEGVLLTSDGEPLSGAPPCKGSLSDEGREWLRVDPPAGVGFNVSGEVSFTQLSPVSAPAVISQIMSPYLLMRREVSLADYARCVSDGACDGHPPEVLVREACLASQSRELDPERYPVNCVSWSQAQSYCEWIGGRLPSEMEWELAVTLHREVFPVPWSIDQGSPEFQRYLSAKNDAFCAYSNYGNCQALNPINLSARPSCHTYPSEVVSPSLPEPIFLDERLFCDASGNLAEWTLDDEDIVSNVPQSGAPVVRGDDVLCAGQLKVTRGGSFADRLPDGVSPNANTLYSLFDRVSYHAREGALCSERLEQVGFRCALPYPSP